MVNKKFININDKIVSNCSKVIVGKEEQITNIVICLICSGHILLEDVPGTGKTVLFRAFAKSIGGDFKRIQFTPDLMPSDVLGINYYNMKTCEFELRKGPIFSNFVLADEINRATPRTQSSLLEAMAEKQVSIDGDTIVLSNPFIVAATQNPIESYGTFPLPEAQLDRFMMKMSLGYMTREQELKVITRKSSDEILATLSEVVNINDIIELKELYSQIKVSDIVLEYLLDIIQATRDDNRINIGASTRGAIALHNTAQVKAAISGRDYVIPEDVKYLAPYILQHRLVYKNITNLSDQEKIFKDILDKVQVPVE